jgi:hypothetical protein
VVPAAPVVLSTQALFAQCCVVVHACPQPPQFTSLAVVSAQLDPHRVCPVEQSVTQAPLLQNWFAGQVVVQSPQWVASDGTQEPLQSIRPDWHWHWLCWQTCPAPQGMPQPAQFIGSDVVSTQSWPQIVCPPAQGLPPVPALPAVPVPGDFTHARAPSARQMMTRNSLSEGELIMFIFPGHPDPDRAVRNSSPTVACSPAVHKRGVTALPS